jgi:hypothetical protein
MIGVRAHGVLRHLNGLALLKLQRGDGRTTLYIRMPRNGILIDRERPNRKTADPELLRFFGVGCDRRSFFSA